MRVLALAALLLCGCASAGSLRSPPMASVPVLSFVPATGPHLTEDVAMGIDGSMLVPSPDGGAPIEIPRRRPVNGTSPVLLLEPAPRLLLEDSMRASGLSSLLWERQPASAPLRSGIEVFRSRQLQLVVGTRTLIDELYPDPVTTDPRHTPWDWENAAVVGLRLGF